MIAELKNIKFNVTGLPGDFEKKMDLLVAKKLKIAPEEINRVWIHQKSLDCRHKKLELIYSFLIDIQDETAKKMGLENVPKNMLRDFLSPSLKLPEESSLKNPIVVGSGPSGIVCALALALAGAKPVILDRGYPIDERYERYRKFLKDRDFDENSNLLIGEGGAGAFSDGKLYTGTKSEFGAFILNESIAAGAPTEIRYSKRPHIGSDYLRKVAIGLRNKITELGGTFRFCAEVRDVLIKNGRCEGVILENGEILSAPAVFMAPGLGGRSLTSALVAHSIDFVLKPFQIGCRIEHPQEFIDKMVYHTAGRPAALGAAEYHILAKNEPAAWNVSSFCMCPGGEILNATAWKNQSITNGMSNFSRRGEYANSCLIVTLPSDYFGSNSEAKKAIEALEKRCFAAGGGNYTLPAQDAEAFLKGQAGLKNRKGSVSCGVVPGRIDEMLLPEQRTALCGALNYFERIYPKFVKYGRFVGVESCVSSPIRFLRNPETLETSLPGLYLGGEGVGCAGGIMSAASDGIRNAIAMLKNYC